MTTDSTKLPPGPYRFEPGETADTYRIFAEGDTKPMAELIYIGGAEDFAGTAAALARLFASSRVMLAALETADDRLATLIVDDHELPEEIEAYQEVHQAVCVATGMEDA